jgi:large subunit ribosomal protein L2
MLIHSRPTTPGQRHRVDVDRSHLHKGEPERELVSKGSLKRQGRGASGHITVRHRGGGVKRKLRVIEWRRRKYGVPAVVQRIEYDPNRSANLALIYYKDGEKAYILAPEGLEAGMTVVSGEDSPIQVGNSLPLRVIPVGSPIHNLELRAGKGAQIVRGAGTAASIQSKEGQFAAVALPSREVRLVNLDCFATIGQVGNSEWKNRKLGKAGRKRLMGIRPTVRGTAQHPDSHPHGGGEGRSGVGMKHPKTPWGKHAHGKKTRKKNHLTNKYIVKDRRVK